MKEILGKKIDKPARLRPPMAFTTLETVELVNSLANPGNPIINWFEGYSNAKAAVHYKNGVYQEDKSDKNIVFDGEIEGNKVNNLSVVAYNGNEGGVYAEGAGLSVEVEDAVINLSGQGKGVGGAGTGAAVNNGAEMTLRNVIIDSHGGSRFCTVAEQYSTLRVYDSLISAHGVPYGEGIDSPQGLMATPPPPLEISGNSRAHCTMSNSYSFFYNSKIICDGWGALSTEVAEGFVYLEANDCEVIATKKGYGAYADPQCHDFFNRCKFRVDGMAAIIAGEGDMTFTDCESKCNSYFALLHCVNGYSEEVGTLIVNKGKISTEKEMILIKSHNADIHLNNAEITAKNNVLLRTILNDDPCKTKPSESPFGVRLTLTEMNTQGDVIHDDNERELWLTLKSTTYKGAVKNGYLDIDKGSKWTATGNSKVIFVSDVNPSQIDAPKGVTIEAKGAEEAEFDLSGGGRLIVKI